MRSRVVIIFSCRPKKVTFAIVEVRKKKRLVFLGSKQVGLYALKRLHEQSEAFGAEIVAVLSNGRSLTGESQSVVDYAEEVGLDVLGHEDELLELEPSDMLISVQYHRILKEQHIRTAAKAVNLHMAPLPEYRGCNQFSFAIVDGAKVFGTTWHVMSPGIDSGPIILERRFPIDSEIGVEELYQQTLLESFKLIDEGLEQIVKGDYEEIDQKSLIPQRGSNFHLRNEINDLKRIDPEWSDDKIDRHIRATSFSGFEPPYALINGKKISLDSNWREVLR